MKDFVTYPVALKLKEKGFREKCFATYTSYSETLKLNEINTDKRPANYKLNIEEFRECYNYYESAIDAPTISQVFKWLREKGIHAQIEISTLGWYGTLYTFGKDEKGLYDINDSYICLGEIYDDYDEAAMSVIEYILDNNLI